MAKSLSADYCFPNRLEDIWCWKSYAGGSADARAPYYLGNFWYAHRRYSEAIECWERHSLIGVSRPSNATWGWLTIMSRRTRSEPGTACELLCVEPWRCPLASFLSWTSWIRERNSGRSSAYPVGGHPDLVRKDDLSIELVTLHNLLGEPARAYDLLMNRVFHPWEGEGRRPDNM
jgi:hypothetical protein